MARPLHCGGSSDDDCLIGSERGDVILGGSGKDTIVSNGGNDVLFGEAGNDTFELKDLGISRIDGGTGIDTLYLTGANQRFDFTALRSDQIQNIEHIDLSSLNSATLTLSNDNLNGLLGGMNDLTGNENSLVISGKRGSSRRSRGQMEQPRDHRYKWCELFNISERQQC